MADSRESSEDFRFPLQGLDLSTGRNAQRPGTTLVGQNVRSYDAGTLRMRGGSRPGITPFFGAGNTTQVSGTNLVQHLNDIVWVTRAALPPPNNEFSVLAVLLEYGEEKFPPGSQAPNVTYTPNWFVGTSPIYTLVSGTCPVLLPGSDGFSTSSYQLSISATTVTLVATFISAGYPGPYFFSGQPQVQTLTQASSSFFNPATSGISGTWLVVNSGLGYIGRLNFSVSVTGSGP